LIFIPPQDEKNAMPRLPRFFRSAPAGIFALALLFAAAARAETQVEMHRSVVPPGEAVSTKGAFSVRMSIPFRDFTLHGADPATGPSSST
jgi:hypothetical protein